jgi:two-component SAPR family response regulator
VTTTVQKEIRKALRFNSLFLCEDGFYSLAQSENSFDVRVAGSRQIKYISLDEISKGMLKIIENNIGLTENELVTETEHAFGFKRTGTNLENRMRESIALLKQANKITINGGKIIVNDANKNTPSAKQEEF